MLNFYIIVSMILNAFLFIMWTEKNYKNKFMKLMLLLMLILGSYIIINQRLLG